MFLVCEGATGLPRFLHVDDLAAQSPPKNHQRRNTMQDRHETKKSFAQMWIDGAREIAEHRVPAEDFGVRI